MEENKKHVKARTPTKEEAQFKTQDEFNDNPQEQRTETDNDLQQAAGQYKTHNENEPAHKSEKLRR